MLILLNLLFNFPRVLIVLYIKKGQILWLLNGIKKEISQYLSSEVSSRLSSSKRRTSLTTLQVFSNFFRAFVLISIDPSSCYRPILDSFVRSNAF